MDQNQDVEAAFKAAMERRVSELPSPLNVGECKALVLEAWQETVPEPYPPIKVSARPDGSGLVDIEVELPSDHPLRRLALNLSR